LVHNPVGAYPVKLKELVMKVKKVIEKMYAAIIAGDKDKEKKMWLEAIQKSLKHKKTQAIQ
jgi:hypothetical protein